MDNIEKIVRNADANARVEGVVLSDETIRMINDCLKTDNSSFLFQLYLKSNKDLLEESEVLVSSKDSKYCYDNGVLKNYLGIKNRDVLDFVASDNAAFYQTQIISGNDNYKFSFDINSYLNLHRKLFGAIFPFAGEIRDEKIYKSCKPYFDLKTPFCEPPYIYEYLKDLLRKMQVKIKEIKCREDLVKYLAYYYGEINMVHPFREGNGRTLRTYFLLLVKELNKYISFGVFDLDFSLWNDEDRSLLEYSTIVNSLNGDTEGIEKCIDKVLVDKKRKKGRG